MYDLLLKYLFNTEFYWLMPMDENRALDGIALRDRFARSRGYSYEEVESILNGPCSVLEMMIALSIRMENDYLFDFDDGDKTGQWFWYMIVNMGLGGCTDDKFDKEYVENVVETFLERAYSKTGQGGLFRTTDQFGDARRREIWVQMCNFVNSLDG